MTFELAAAFLCGLAASWIIRSLMADRALSLARAEQARALEALAERQQQGMAGVLAGANEKIQLSREDHLETDRERKALREEERAAWDREREAMAAVNSQYYAQIESLHTKLLASMNGRKVDLPAVADKISAEPPSQLKTKVDRVLGEEEGWDKQVTRLVENGFTQEEAESWLAGDLPDENLPEFGQRVDRMILNGIKDGTGIS